MMIVLATIGFLSIAARLLSLFGWIQYLWRVIDSIVTEAKRMGERGESDELVREYVKSEIEVSTAIRASIKSEVLTRGAAMMIVALIRSMVNAWK